MINAEDIKAVATPQSVARYFLGTPFKERNDILWYKSPFREETEPSFEVTSQGMHDFGSDEHYDIFSFTQKIKHCGFHESVEILASMFGVAGREYATKETTLWYRKELEKQRRYKEILDWFFLRVWDEVDKELKENKECREIFKPRSNEDEFTETYAILLNQHEVIWGMEEYLAQECDTWEEKEELMKQALRGDLPTWLMNRLKATMTLPILNTKLKQRREY